MPEDSKIPEREVMALNGNPEEIVSILKEEIARYEEEDPGERNRLRHSDRRRHRHRLWPFRTSCTANFCEFENGVKALAMNLETGSVGCALLGPEEGLQEGIWSGVPAGGRTCPQGKRCWGGSSTPWETPSTARADPHLGNPAHRA